MHLSPDLELYKCICSAFGLVSATHTITSVLAGADTQKVEPRKGLAAKEDLDGEPAPTRPKPSPKRR